VFKMLDSLIELRGGWHRARVQLGKAFRVLGARSAKRSDALEKANDDLRAAQADLEKRWQYLAEAQKLSHSGTFGWKVSSGELVWSEETRRILGFSREANPTLDLVFDRIHPEDRERMEQVKEHAVNNGMDIDVEYRLLLAGGIIKHVHSVAHAGRDSSGNFEYMGVLTDMTERKRVDEERQALARKLEESNARLEEAQRVAHVGHWEWDLETNEVIWSDETYRIFGLKPQERPMDLAGVRGMVHPDDRESLYGGVDVDLSAGANPVAEFRIVRPGGEFRTVHAITSKRRSAPPVDSNGEAPERARKLFGTVQDITENKRVEEERQALSRDLQESNARLEQAQRLVHMGYYEWNLVTGRVTWSAELHRIYGLPPQDGPIDMAMVGGMIHPDDRERVFREADEAVRNGVSAAAEHRIVRPDGEVRTVHGLGTVKRDAAGLACEMFGTVQDITDRKRAEEALRQSQLELRREQAYLAEAQSLTHIGSWAANFHTGQNYHVSDEVYRLHGFEPTQGPLAVERFWKTIHPEDEPLVRAILTNAIHARTDFENPEYRICLPDGTIRYLRAIGHHDPSGEMGEYVGITMDITERKRAEAERERLRRLEADLARVNRVNMMGELAAALAHEIKQPITASITSADALLRWLAHDPPDLDRARAAASRIEEDANRAANVIDSLRSFYKTGTPSERQIIDVKEIIEEMTGLLRGEADRHGITIYSELEADSPNILVNPVQLQQVFMNLMLNAIEAMKDTGGDLTIRSRVNPQSGLCVSISDTGIGLPAGSAEQIFEPFHTTKPQGTGMGLTITRSIVEAYGGRVWAAANQGMGATFHFSLPCEAEGQA
jgi:PAS domain S-box-containing protein